MKIIGKKYIVIIDYNEFKIIKNSEDAIYDNITLYCYEDDKNIDNISTIITVINDRVHFEAVSIGDAIYHKVSLSIRKHLDNSTISYTIRKDSDDDIIVDIKDEIEKYEYKEVNING